MVIIEPHRETGELVVVTYICDNKKCDNSGAGRLIAISQNGPMHRPPEGWCIRYRATDPLQAPAMPVFCCAACALEDDRGRTFDLKRPSPLIIAGVLNDFHQLQQQQQQGGPPNGLHR